MGHNRFTYANNSRRVLPLAQIYLVGMMSQPGNPPLSLLQTRSLGLRAGRPAVRNRPKYLKNSHLHPGLDVFNALARRLRDK